VRHGRPSVEAGFVSLWRVQPESKVECASRAQWISPASGGIGVFFRGRHCMMITGLSLRNFRNHTATTVEFSSGINALVGRNGQGKTNLLEAISYLGLTKSFYATADVEALQVGREKFEVEGTLKTEAQVVHSSQVRFTRSPLVKTYAIDGTPVDRLSSVIGQFPVVILSPENGTITGGPPAERRKFMDILLSQISATYLRDLLEYRRILRQRNRILADGRLRGTAVDGLIDPWTENLAEYGARIIRRRRTFVGEFQNSVTSAYRELVDAGEEPGLTYVPGVKVDQELPPEALAGAIVRALHSLSVEEKRRGLTLTGPHRDELSLTINGLSVQRFASQGQHKTLQVALKIAEFRYVSEHRGESPLFLLDDMFSELDRDRSERILAVTSSMGQTVITATDERPFGTSFHWGGRDTRFSVVHGTCTPKA
jgi:DNA replication and repair protein RecF